MSIMAFLVGGAIGFVVGAIAVVVFLALAITWDVDA